MTKRSLEISFKIFIICVEVLLSKEPVGSSAKTILGSVTIALAIAVLWFWPPETWLGFWYILSSRPTAFKASLESFTLLSLGRPEILGASSTFSKRFWWGIKL